MSENKISEKIVAILQARMGSSRLPGKTLNPILGKPMLWYVLERLRQSKKINQIIVATTKERNDDAIESLCNELEIDCYRGSSDDVLARYVGAVKKFGGDIIVRVTADCPLLDFEVIDKTIEEFQKGGADYVSNTNPPTYPDGLDVEVFSYSVLMQANKEASLHSEREHVTPYIWNHPNIFKLRNVENEVNLSSMRWTVDEPQDFEFVCEVYGLLGKNNMANMEEIIDVLVTHPELSKRNQGFVRNEGYAKSIKED